MNKEEMISQLFRHTVIWCTPFGEPKEKNIRGLCELCIEDLWYTERFDSPSIYFQFGPYASDVIVYRLKDYGSTWAFTEEELKCPIK